MDAQEKPRKSGMIKDSQIECISISKKPTTSNLEGTHGEYLLRVVLPKTYLS